MIDTNELRELADSLQYSHACKCGDNGKCHTVNIMEDSADELDRLYEIERRNTPLTREQIAAKMKRHGMFISKTNHNTRVVLNVPFSAVTLQLLDAVLEAK